MSGRLTRSKRSAPAPAAGASSSGELSAGAKRKRSEPELLCVSTFESSFDCPVCLDLLAHPVVACCGHHFCKFCYTSWATEHNNTGPGGPKCPVCRARIARETPGICKCVEATIQQVFPDRYQQRVDDTMQKQVEHDRLRAAEEAERSDMHRRLLGRLRHMLAGVRNLRSVGGGGGAGAASARGAAGASAGAASAGGGPSDAFAAAAAFAAQALGAAEQHPASSPPPAGQGSVRVAQLQQFMQAVSAAGRGQGASSPGPRGSEEDEEGPLGDDGGPSGAFMAALPMMFPGLFPQAGGGGMAAGNSGGGGLPGMAQLEEMFNGPPEMFNGGPSGEGPQLTLVFTLMAPDMPFPMDAPPPPPAAPPPPPQQQQQQPGGAPPPPRHPWSGGPPHAPPGGSAPGSGPARRSSRFS